MTYSELLLLTAIRAIAEVVFKCTSALPAHGILAVCDGWFLVLKIQGPGRLLATSTIQKRRSLLDPEQRDEKQAQIVVHPLAVGLIEAAPRTSAGGGIQRFGFGLHAGNDETHRVLISLLKNSGLADNFADAHVEQIRLIGRFDDQCGIRAPGRSADGDNIVAR